MIGDTFILNETLFSQWGYEYVPTGKPLGDNDILCFMLSPYKYTVAQFDYFTTNKYFLKVRNLYMKF